MNDSVTPLTTPLVYYKKDRYEFAMTHALTLYLGSGLALHSVTFPI